MTSAGDQQVFREEGNRVICLREEDCKIPRRVSARGGWAEGSWSYRQMMLWLQVPQRTRIAC